MKHILSLLATVALTTNFAHSFGGPLVGIELGAGYLNSDHYYTSDGTNIPISGPKGSGEKAVSKVGFFYGGFAEYLHEVGDSKTFVGGGLHFNTSGTKKSVDFGVDGGPVIGQVTIDRLAGVAPTTMVGKLMNPKVMLYTGVSYEFAKYELTYSSGGVNKKVSKKFKAVVPTVGIMYRVSDNIIIGASYAHTFFKKKDVLVNFQGATTQLDPTENRGMVRVAYRFNVG